MNKMESERSTSQEDTKTQNTQDIPSPEKSIQDLFQWFGKMATDYTSKLNENASVNFDMIGKDLKNLYSRVGSMVLEGQDMMKMTAQEIRSKTSEELYQKIKINVLLYRDICKYSHKTNCVSVPILEEVKKRLLDEGFDVNYVLGETSTNINIEW